MWQMKISLSVLLLVTLCAGGVIRERKNKMREEKEKESKKKNSDDESLLLIPDFPEHRFQYAPVLFPVYNNFDQGTESTGGVTSDVENETEDTESNTEDPDVRSHGASIVNPDDNSKTDSRQVRREVLLWPRPCGWEWDGNTFRWGPCNTIFGGPGFPW